MRRRVIFIVLSLVLALIALRVWRRSEEAAALTSAQSQAKLHAALLPSPYATSDTSSPPPSVSPPTPTGPVLDRARADRLRAAAHAASAAAAQAKAAGTPLANEYPEMPDGTATADGGSPLRDYVRSIVREDYFPLARQCYDTTLAKNPKLAGRIEMSFAIVGDRKSGGVVDTAEFDDTTTTIADTEFRTCLRESMLSVSFAAPPNGRVTVKYPIEFAPAEEEASDGGTR